MATSFMIGDFKLTVSETTAQRPVVTTIYENKEVEKQVRKLCHEAVTDVVTVGCGTRCAALQAYTKSSLARAIKLGDLSRHGQCYTCGMMATVGPAKSHKQEVTNIVPVWKDVTVKTVEQVPVTRTVYESVTTPLVTSELVEKEVADECASACTRKTPIRIVQTEHPEGKAAIAPPHSPTQKATVKSGLRLPHLGRRLVAEYDERITTAFAKFADVATISPPPSSLSVVHRKTWPHDESQAVVISINGPTIREPITDIDGPRGKITCTRCSKKPQTFRTVYNHPHLMDNIMRFLANQAKKGTITIDIISSRKKHNEYRRARKHNGTEFKVTTMHHRRKYKLVDVHTTTMTKMFEDILVQKSNKEFVDTAQLTHGDSGRIIAHSRLKGDYTKHRTHWLIVRGRFGNRLIDSRIKQSWSRIRDIEHYTDEVSRKFWNGFNRTFVKYRPQNLNHICTSNFDVESCGSVAAMVCQTIMPCGKITCRQCAVEHSLKSAQDVKEILARTAPQCMQDLNTLYPEFVNVSNFLSLYTKTASATNTNFEAFNEIQRIIGDRKEAPFAHVVKINELLIKGNLATTEEFSVMSTLLLELARYLKNRTENIKVGSLASFRNKASGKANINPTLMCDNQLDVNGNFVWGKRGFHAKRFFSNYFDEIDPTLGYEKYTNRVNPNGSRLLAINNLIVSTNFETLRNQLKGIPIKPAPLAQYCVSKRNGNFEYPCCCVTHEDGRPLESEVKMPTKNHLVIGNTGDSKYVDLPTDISTRMYIAKQGYCYINIFLAMLVNVNESDAKDFTKMVRDVIMDKLGKWPSMLDVATACFLLKTFFPDVHNAELPRILVDHNTKTMHVIDSYGSQNTGYHVLKATTVSQLILFAGDSLDSEMKHYLVGGDVTISNIETSNLKLLVRSIYRPKLMKEVLMEEPYLILLSILSPGVLLALFNSGSLERMTVELVRHDKDLMLIASLLSALALKVSLAHTLTEQFNIINANASTLIDTLNTNSQKSHSKDFAMMTLLRIQARNDTEKTLLDIGFTSNQSSVKTQHLIEKNYLQDLEDSWRELTLFGKLSAIKESYRWRKRTPGPLFPQSTADLKGRYDISVQALVGTATWKGKQCVRTISGKAISTGRCITNHVTKSCYSFVNRLIPDIFRFINVLIILSLFLQITVSARHLLAEHKKAKMAAAQLEEEKVQREIISIYKNLYRKLEQHPTKEEFIEHMEQTNPKLIPKALECIEFKEDVNHQAKKASEANLEKVIAFTSLILMIFDQERSDCVYKILNKLKGIMGTIDADVYHQSIDDIQHTLEERKQTIDFEVDSGPTYSSKSTDTTFGVWWANQIEMNNVIPHYRTEGHFMEFTRETAAAVANSIAHNEFDDILLRGGVGSGKSTGLPYNLCSKGRVLLLEPTRPLAENVCKQLRGSPFFANPTLRMRGLTSFGSTPISVMTSGFALHYYANNPQQLADYKYIIFDECHVNDSCAMAFRCLLKEFTFTGKIIKVSATPPGREVELAPQHSVTVTAEETVSFPQFIAAQGTGSNIDVISKGDNILVYVASYNEVDTLSRGLLDKGFKVTKVDGRTMKVGSVEIVTSGTPSHKHFIVATNIIENGVTLDIDVVVDFGMKVSPYLDVESRMIRYCKVGVSYGERIQRLGRVGRHKRGFALRIGSTEKGLVQIPAITATEAAFLCFTYGLPVMTHNVSTSFLSGCTVRQARVMQHFELPAFYTVNLVRFDGTMHQAIHALLKPFKLRDSEITLNRLAIPSSAVPSWMTAHEYAHVGVVTNLDSNVRIPFYTREIPETLHGKIWDAVQAHKGDAGFGRLTSANASKVAYTLQTDVHSLKRTICTIEYLLTQEMEKQAHYRSVIGSSCSSTDFSLASITTAIRARYSTNHSAENISILQAALAQIKEFDNLHDEFGIQSKGLHTLTRDAQEYGALGCVYHQSEEDIVRTLKLKGTWNKSLITRDVIVLAGVLGGGAWMLYTHFKEQFLEPVYHQGFGKRTRQKLKFRNAREAKVGREVFGDDGTIEHYFGSAYTKKGKKPGKTHGMGAKTRRFTNMYGYDPADFSFVRFVDPLTGYTIDDSPYTDIQLIQNQITDARLQALDRDELEAGHLRNHKRIEAYYIKNSTSPVLKVDLTPHNPLLVGGRTNNISGFPEREFELRQTGPAQQITYDQVPKIHESPPNEEVEHEGESTFKGMRDYNPIASVICQLVNESDGHREKVFGLGYGSFIITNQHLFRNNNGKLEIKSKHGDFTIKNTTQLKLLPCKGRDIVVIQLPKDFPPFPQKLQFRQPKSDERICMVGSLFQDKSVTSTVSETSTTYPLSSSHFWKHWITTKDGHCGLPLVSTSDGNIVGIHSLSNMTQTHQYYVAFPDTFVKDFLNNPESQAWQRNWRYNANEVCWGSLNLRSHPPDKLFKTHKLISDLDTNNVYTQSKRETWVLNQLAGNLKAVAYCPSQLVTKHTVKGKCVLFDTYLQTHDEEREFFKPLLDAYQKSKLNKEAYLKDVMKYSTPITIGEVDTEVFEQAQESVIAMLHRLGFGECDYVTDENAIFSSLNMKSAVGALYTGKKKDYFAEFTDKEKEQIVQDSCYRLYRGFMGIWNGSLKAELRPKEKVDANKTRTFTAAPLDTLLGGKVCVDDFNNRFYSLNTTAPWSVGMTKFYGGWDKLLRALPEGWIYCDADGSQFDSSLSPYLINAVLNIRMEFMEPWDIGEQMLSNLYTEIIYTPIATPDGTIVKKFKGNNSGQPSTVVDNTLMVILAMHYTLMKCSYPPDQHDSVCKYFANGDDLLVAIHPDHAHILDDFSHHFLDLGLKYDFSSRHTDKSNLWFMSHQGKIVDGLYIPKLEPERIVSILQWDRALLPEHRLEAICAAMIESWGHFELTHEIRKFYKWVLEQAPYNELARDGKAPYIAETALRRLYTNVEPEEYELEAYLDALKQHELEYEDDEVYHQADERQLDAGRERERKERERLGTPQPIVPQADKDVNVGTSGGNKVPRLKQITGKMNLPKTRGKIILNLDHLLNYVPSQVDISNTRSTHSQFTTWYEGVKSDYGVDDEGMSVIMNGLMVWCIENGTSPNINGVWVMMDGDEQVEFPIKPLIDHAKPTLRQIMAHFSSVAEAYIEKRNNEKPYMPRYGLQRGLNDMSLARYAFDFYEMTSNAPIRAREACMQMKASALTNKTTRLFGLDGNVGTQEEDTERHTVNDVNRRQHTLNGSKSY
ncbi:polyprotein [Polygonatnum kingianum mottle virus]|nr:polyprotein [Polygonatnum kingianum mottle virus]